MVTLMTMEEAEKTSASKLLCAYKTNHPYLVLTYENESYTQKFYQPINFMGLIYRRAKNEPQFRQELMVEILKGTIDEWAEIVERLTAMDL